VVPGGPPDSDWYSGGAILARQDLPVNHLGNAAAHSCRRKRIFRHVYFPLAAAHYILRRAALGVHCGLYPVWMPDCGQLVLGKAAEKVSIPGWLTAPRRYRVSRIMQG